MSDSESENDQKAKNTRYKPQGPPHYECNLCHQKFGTQYSIQRHFEQTCSPNNGSPAGTQWDDHPSCMTANKALTLPHARPLYPVYQVERRIGDQLHYTLTWPVLSGWPTDPAELLRKNEAHLALPGANPHYVDSKANVYADVNWNTDDHVSGEGPLEQLHNLIQLINENNVKHLAQLARSGRWPRSFADDVFLAVALHKSNAELALFLDLGAMEVDQWLTQACQIFFDHHVKVASGPNDPNRLPTDQQLATWKEMIKELRKQHEDPTSEAFRRLACCGDGVIDEVFEAVKGITVEEDSS